MRKLLISTQNNKAFLHVLKEFILKFVNSNWEDICNVHNNDLNIRKH